MAVSVNSCKAGNEITCMNCRKKNLSLLGDLTLKELAVLEEQRYQLDYKAGEKIYRENEK